MSLPIPRPQASGRTKPAVALRIDRLTKTFDRRTVLNGITLDVPAGQFLAIVGRSGSGKSTLLRLLCGLDQPTSGRLVLDGAASRPDVVRMMFQEPRLLPWLRVIDNVAVGLGEAVPRGNRVWLAAAALQAVGLEHRAGDWPTVLSGGQKQRVALARALVSRPSLLLFDEPLGALDALTRLEMQDLVAATCLDQGFTSVLVTHDVAEAVRLADRILLLERGVVTLDIPNPLPRPRQGRSAEAAALEAHVLDRLMSA